MTNEEKDKIYDFLSSFLIKRQILNMKGEERLNLKLDKILIENDYILELPKITLENVKNYLTSHWDKKCGIKECNNNKKSIGLLPRRNTKDIYPFCSKKCASFYFSNIQKGDNNTSHKMTEETRKKSYKKQSISMKKKIKDGLFVPPISNSWAKENSYNYVIITDEWFKNNYDEKLVLNQSCTEKLIRNLKQFKNENKKNKKNRL